VIIKLEHDILSGDFLSIYRPNMHIFGLNKLFDRKIVNATGQRFHGQYMDTGHFFSLRWL